MSQKNRIIIGAWAAVGSATGLYVYRRQRDFEERLPCIRDAVNAVAAAPAARAALGGGDLQVAPWFRHGSLDAVRGGLRANFQVSGSSGSARVLLSARRRRSAQEALEEREEEEEAEQPGGWRYYFNRPWEIKRAVTNRWRKWTKASPAQPAEEEELGWDIEALVLLPAGDATQPMVIMGDPRSLPDYEAECVRRDAQSKGETSRQRLHMVIGLTTAAALLAGGFRLARSARVSRTHGFVRRSVLGHKDVIAALGPDVMVRSTQGTFKPTYINAKLRLVGQNGEAADVQMTAIRDKGINSPWRIPLARMRLGGLSYNLDMGQQ